MVTRDSSPVYSLAGAEAFADAVGRARALGFTDVVAHWPRAAGRYTGDEKMLKSIAGQLPRLRLCRLGVTISRAPRGRRW
jgi:hypothetical protein